MNAPLMEKIGLEARPLYGIGTVARLTGLKPDTLRVWERRYGLKASHKSQTGRRQYTQADLDHFHLIAYLVDRGVKIGEIAKSDRKTLEMLLEQQGDKQSEPLPSIKPKALFIGHELCGWLDKHQGCISGVSAFLARMTVAEAMTNLQEEQPVDILVVHSASLTLQQIKTIETIFQRTRAKKTLVLYQFANDQWLSELKSMGHTSLQYPIEASQLAFELGKIKLDQETRMGVGNVSEMMPAKPKIFNDAELRAAAEEKIVLDCECPRHLSDLIRSLNEFEDYSSACSVDNWKDAAIHTSIYAYTCQARHLMEKALQAAMDGKSLAK